ncbi:c-type cytochrome [Falsiroseomonas sp.]|uniref:c-type cytochrome n=1 Tax=Falsiroseomonas sp. TaxID=2870721 RepID=UPI0035634089
MLRHILLASGLLAAPAAMGQTPPHLLAGGCQGCHGVAGQGGHGIPMIHETKTRAEFVAVMREFRDNQRPGTVMGRIARGYTEAEYAVLAQHFAKPE